MRSRHLRYGMTAVLALVFILAAALGGRAQSPVPPPATAAATAPAPAAISAATTAGAVTATRPATATPAASAPTPSLAVGAPLTVTRATAAPTGTATTATTVAVTATAAATAVVTSAVTAPAVTATAVPAALSPTLASDGPVVAEPPSAVELTVYNQNLALVQEERRVALRAGENQVLSAGVAAGLLPASVRVASLTDPKTTAVLEQTFAYDLVGTASLLTKYVDREISLVTKGGTAYAGTLLSGAKDIILSSDRGITIVKLAEVSELSLPALTKGMTTRPTLTWLVRAPRAGPQELRVTYLTEGLTWSADYTLLLAPDERTGAWNGWMTIANQSGANYADAQLTLVAGDVRRVSRADGIAYDGGASKALLRAAEQVEVQASGLFEYYRFAVPRPITLAHNQTKQIPFTAAPIISTTKVYLLDAAPRALARGGNVILEADYGLVARAPVQVRIELVNTAASGLGLALPQGVVRVYRADADGGLEFVGEDAIAHTPRGEPVSLELGSAFDLVGERRQVAYSKLGERALEETYALTLRNRKAEDVQVRVVERLFRAEDARLTEVSAAYKMLDATTFHADLEVKAEAQATLTYTVRYAW